MDGEVEMEGRREGGGRKGEREGEVEMEGRRECLKHNPLKETKISDNMRCKKAFNYCG